MSEQEDVLLVRRCLEGDKAAFEAIVEKYQKVVFNLALKMVNNYEDAEDIAQSVFVKIFQNLRGFDPKHKFFSWIYRATINESLNCINQRKPKEELSGESVSQEQTPHETYVDQETSAQVQNAIDDLKPEYKTVILLKHFQNLSYSEISEILDIPEKTVKSRLFTARQLLKEILIKKKGISP